MKKILSICCVILFSCSSTMQAQSAPKELPSYMTRVVTNLPQFEEVEDGFVIKPAIITRGVKPRVLQQLQDMNRQIPPNSKLISINGFTIIDKISLVVAIDVMTNISTITFENEGVISDYTFKLAGGYETVVAKELYYKRLTGEDVRLAIIVGEVRNVTTEGKDTKWAEATREQVLINQESYYLKQKNLGTSGKFNLVDRAETESILGELGFQSSGIISQNTALQVGKLSGANYILFCNFSRHPHPDTRVADINDIQTFRLINVENGEVVSTMKWQSKDF